MEIDAIANNAFNQEQALTNSWKLTCTESCVSGSSGWALGKYVETAGEGEGEGERKQVSKVHREHGRFNALLTTNMQMYTAHTAATNTHLHK